MSDGPTYQSRRKSKEFNRGYDEALKDLDRSASGKEKLKARARTGLIKPPTSARTKSKPSGV